MSIDILDVFFSMLRPGAHLAGAPDVQSRADAEPDSLALARLV